MTSMPMLCVTVICISLITALMAEFISWFLIYRKPEHARMKKKLEASIIKLNKCKEQVSNASTAKQLQKAKSAEKRMKESMAGVNQEMQQKTMKSTFALYFIQMGMLYCLNKYFSGVVVARLPFEPLSLFRKLSHRNIEGDDFGDCSMIFLYILCGMALRGNIKKFLGHEMPKGIPSSWDLAQEKAEETANKWTEE